MSMDYKIIVGQNVKHYRNEAGWNQATLGMLALGYAENDRAAAQRRITNIELGTVNVTIQDLHSIATTLGRTIEELMAPDREKHRSGDCFCSGLTPPILGFCKKLRDICESEDTVMKTAIESNIIAFHEAVKRKPVLEALGKDNKNMKRQISNLESAIEELRRENRSIADHQKEFTDAAPPTGTDEGDGMEQ